MKSTGARALLFGSIVGGLALIGPSLRTYSSLKEEVLQNVNSLLSEAGYRIGADRSCHLRITPGRNGILLCYEDVSGRMLHALNFDDSPLPKIVRETVEIRDIRSNSEGLLDKKSGDFQVITP